MAVIRVFGAGALAALMAEERTHAPNEAENADRRRLAGIFFVSHSKRAERGLESRGDDLSACPWIPGSAPPTRND